MAPHHGSHLTNTPDLARWAQPRVVVSCQGRTSTTAEVGKRYTRVGAHFLDTNKQGAVTIRSSAGGLVVETFRTGQRIAVRGARSDD
jgi:beta-lactamase superfamily II metal-dependent hydrolase